MEHLFFSFFDFSSPPWMYLVKNKGDFRDPHIVFIKNFHLNFQKLLLNGRYSRDEFQRPNNAKYFILI